MITTSLFITLLLLDAALIAIAFLATGNRLFMDILSFFFNDTATTEIYTRLVVGSVAKAVWDAIVTAVGWLRDRVVGAWDAIVAGVRKALDWVKGKWDWLQDKLSTIVGKIKDFLGGIWDGLKSGAKAAANAAIRIVNGIIGGINTVIDGINLLPGVSIPHIPRIPQLAKGGVVTRPTLAMVGEGNESEAVLPLSKLDAMLSNDRGAGDRPLVVENHIEIGGEVVRVVEQYVNERDRTLTRRVLAGVGGAR